jgi:transposase-like protein
VVEQRYRAVLEVLEEGISVTEVARRHGVVRQTVHEWLARYAVDGLAGLADWSSRPVLSPHQMAAVTEARIVGMRREHPGRGLSRIRWELERAGWCVQLEQITAEGAADAPGFYPSPSTGGGNVSPPEFVEAALPCQHAPGDRWFADKTYVKVAGASGLTFTGRSTSMAKSSTSCYAARPGYRPALLHPAIGTDTIAVEVTTDRSPVYPRVLDVTINALRREHTR